MASMIAVGSLIGPPSGTGIAVGAIVTVIVLLGAVKWLAFVPGMFVGCYSTFAINADWQLLGLSLVAGAVLGMLCDWGADLVVARWGSRDAVPANA